MKLLVLGMNYAPEQTGIAPFTTELCEYLAQRGNTVTVATTFPHYPEWRTQSAYAGKRSMTERRNGVTLKRKKVFLPKRASTLQRVMYDTSLGAGTLLSGLGEREYDLVLGVAPPIQVGVTARLLARRKGVPYILWIQDLALEAAMSVGMMRENRMLKLAQRLELWSYARAARLFVISSGFAENLRRKQVPAERLRFMPNWVDTEFIGAVKSGNGFRREHGLKDDAFVVLHSGNMGAKQQLQNVLLAAEHLQPCSDISFVLVGEGSEKGELVAQAERDNLGNVRFLPLVPRNELPYMLATADLLVVNQHPDMVDAVIPSKLLTYMAAGRAVVVAAHPESEAARQVDAAGCGIWVKPDEPQQLANAVLALSKDPLKRRMLGERGREYASKHFARASQLNAFESELLSVLR